MSLVAAEIRRAPAALALTLSLVAGAGLCGRPSAAAEDPRVAWLRAHAIPLSTLDPASDDLADLAPLRDLLGGVRVVMLGEASRGDGSAFLAKTRLIRFLHQEMGFDVVAFEGGFYDCARAWERIRAGGEARRTLGRCLFPLYTDAAQFQPLIELIAERAGSDRPLAVAGIDPQMGGGGAGGGGEDLLATLRPTLGGFGIEPAAVEGYAALDAALRDVLGERHATGQVPVPDRRARRRVLATLAELRRRLEEAPERPRSGDRAFWLQVLANLESHVRASWASGPWQRGEGFDTAAHNLRDRQMAANVVWLARQRYPERKLVVWSLNVHLARDLDLLTTGEAAVRQRFDEMSTVGDAVAAALGNEVYTLAATAFTGSKSTLLRDPHPLLPVTAGSFEELMARTGLDAALVDLRRLPSGGAWLRRALIARPISYKELLGIWPRHVDGLLFLRRMEPARPAE